IPWPVGYMVNGNLSAMVSPKPNFISKETSLLGEVAWNHLLSVTYNDTYTRTPSAGGSPVQVPYLTNTGITRDAMDFMLLWSATYRQVISNMDLSFPIALNFSPYGKS